MDVAFLRSFHPDDSKVVVANLTIAAVGVTVALFTTAEARPEPIRS